jgi:serine O-acetyltransferase
MVEPIAHADAPQSEGKADAQAWQDSNESKPLPFWQSLRSDLIAQVPPEQRDKSPLRWALLGARVGATSPGFKVTMLYRVNHALVHRAGTPGKVLAGIINGATRFVYGSSIAPRARIHGGFVLPHPQGVTIGSEVVIGPRVWVFQYVTMGATYGKAGQPSIGADCRIHVGAVIGGPVKIGDGVVVTPNAFVQRNVPSQSMAVGVPANVFPRFAKPKA